MLLLHCLPGPPGPKVEALVRLGTRMLAEDGVLMGATILGDDAPHNLLGRFLILWHNVTGVFGNRQDDVETFVKELEKAFVKVEWEVVGVVLVFKASGIRP
ncbi:hypothetical protein LZ32DRAFT_611725 [Colletotrichum eremochloae]|nr:hypothetical protein LZ32DRAFT_611725 [Colletotrichum eremochloae]